MGLKQTSENHIFVLHSIAIKGNILKRDKEFVFSCMYNKRLRYYFYKFVLSASMLRPQAGSRAAVHWLGMQLKQG